MKIICITLDSFIFDDPPTRMSSFRKIVISSVSSVRSLSKCQQTAYNFSTSKKRVVKSTGRSRKDIQKSSPPPPPVNADDPWVEVLDKSSGQA
jgi:hypothetical protein